MIKRYINGEWKNINKIYHNGNFIKKIYRDGNFISMDSSLLPQGYTQYDYLERGNNNAYINTGLYANNNTEMELDFMVLDMNGGTSKNMAGTVVTDNQFYFRFVTINTAVASFGSSSMNSGALYNPTFKELNRRYLWKLNKNGFYINNSLMKSFTETEFANEGTNNIFLFQCRNSGSDNALRVYGFKLRENGVLIANYIPCQRDSDGVCGMYDLVSNTFKPSSNSYQFTCGNDSILEGYTKYDYLAKTDYRQYIDTGLGYSDKTEVELGFKMIDQITTSYTNLFGCYDKTNAQELYLRFVMSSAYNGVIGDESITTNVGSAVGSYRDPSPKWIYTLNKDGFYVNGNRIKALSDVAEFTNNNTLWLGRLGKASQTTPLFQIYSLRIRENEVLVADYIPVKRNSDGKCGMYDLVSGTFKTDVSGYSEMICGND